MRRNHVGYVTIASDLCATQPTMPSQALANWHWGEREHPKYQNSHMVCTKLWGLGRLNVRMVSVKPADNTDPSETAIVGNTIFVSQPSPEFISVELPPKDSQRALYAGYDAEHRSSMLSKKKSVGA